MAKPVLISFLFTVTAFLCYGEGQDCKTMRREFDMRIYTLTHIKGGVLKTTTTVNLAYAFARLGYKTLIIDADAQANALRASPLFSPTSTRRRNAGLCSHFKAKILRSMRPNSRSAQARPFCRG